MRLALAGDAAPPAATADARRLPGPRGHVRHEALTTVARRPAPRARRAANGLRHGHGRPRRRRRPRLVPIENSLEGSVNATLDTLAVRDRGRAIVGEVVHPIRHCLIAREAVALERRSRPSCSHPQATAQCARFLRDAAAQTPTVLPANSTADAVRRWPRSSAPWAALGNRLSAELYGCEVLARRRRGHAGQRDALRLAGARGRRGRRSPARGRRRSCSGAPATTSPGWLVALPVGVRLPRREPHDDRVAAAQARPRPLHVLRRPRGPGDRRGGRGGDRGGARRRPSTLRVLGSYPAALERPVRGSAGRRPCRDAGYTPHYRWTCT